MELDSIPVFVKVAQLGSFTQASTALKMPTTTVSAKVAQLERHLGVTLIQRTTRKDYLKKEGAPKDLTDLKKFRIIHFSPLSDEDLEFTNGKQTVKRTAVRGPIEADDFGTLKALAELGHGIAMLPDFLCENDTSENRLVKVLPEWWGKAGNFALVYPSQPFVPPKVRAFIEVAEEFFKKC